MNNENNNLNGTVLGSTTTSPDMIPNNNPINNELNSVDNTIDTLESTPVNNEVPSYNANPSELNNNSNMGNGQFFTASNNFSNIPTNDNLTQPSPMDNNVNNFSIPNNQNNPNDLNINPPIMDDNSNNEFVNKPKKKNKLLFILIIVLVLGVIGFGTYYILKYTNILNNGNKVNIEIHNLEIGLNEEIPDDSVLATITGANNCTFDKSKVDNTKAGTYEFSVKCGNITKNGTITVVEGITDVNTLKVKDVYKAVGDTLEVNEFIIDPSYTYEFANSDEVNGYLGTTGEYDVKIKAVDASNKEIETIGKLYVTENPIRGYLKCKTNEQNVADSSATMVASYEFGISMHPENGNVYGGLGFEKYSFTFSDETEYNTYFDSYKKGEDITINNITSNDIEFNDIEKTITINKKMDNDAVKNQFGDSKYSDIKAYYMDNLKYNCIYE